METQVSGWFVMLLGMGTVFVGLICLIFITMLMSFLLNRKKPEAAAAAPAAAAPAAAAPAAAPATIANRPQFVAAVAAAIATEMGTEPAGLRIHSIRPAGSAAAGDRGSFVAAVAAAIAAETGTEASGLRIHSIRQV